MQKIKYQWYYWFLPLFRYIFGTIDFCHFFDTFLPSVLYFRFVSFFRYIFCVRVDNFSLRCKNCFFVYIKHIQTQIVYESSSERHIRWFLLLILFNSCSTAFDWNQIFRIYATNLVSLSLYSHVATWHSDEQFTSG